MPRVMSAAVSPGLCAPGPAGPSASTCATVVSRSCCLARAEARTAATSATHDTSARQANTAASTMTVSRTSDQSAPSPVTETMTSDSSRACVMTSTAVITPRTTAIAMKPRVLRA